ncbi:MAG: hypothetical protein V2A77_06815 [Pseudomonadota bacterium]
MKKLLWWLFMLSVVGAVVYVIWNKKECPFGSQGEPEYKPEYKPDYKEE